MKERPFALEAFGHNRRIKKFDMIELHEISSLKLLECIAWKWLDSDCIVWLSQLTRSIKLCILCFKFFIHFQLLCVSLFPFWNCHSPTFSFCLRVHALSFVYLPATVIVSLTLMCPICMCPIACAILMHVTPVFPLSYASSFLPVHK